MPRVTVVLSSFNHEGFVSEAIESVLAQSFGDFELFVVDDDSGDGSWDVIRKCKDPRVQALRNTSRQRAAAGFNHVIANLARGQFIAIHHSDDVWLPRKLEAQVALLDSRPAVGAVFSPVIAIDERGVPLAPGSHKYAELFNQENRPRQAWLRRFFEEGNCLCHPSVLARRESLIGAGLYDRRFGQLTDLDLWIRLCLHAEIHVLAQPQVKFRILLNYANESADRPDAIHRGQMETLQILRRYLAIPGLTELARIFPQIEIPPEAKDRDVPFLVARFAAGLDAGIPRVFGLLTLYELLKDDEVAREIERRHGFSYVQLVALAGMRDCLGWVKYREALQHYEATRDALHTTRQELERIVTSPYWHITKPLRIFARAIRRATGLLPTRRP